MNWDDVDDILFDGTPEQIAAVRCPDCNGEIYFSYTRAIRSEDKGCKGCGLQIRAHGAHYVPNYAKTSMLVKNIIYITGRGKYIAGDINNEMFKQGDIVEIIRNNEIIGLTVIKSLEHFSTTDRQGAYAIKLQKNDNFEVLPGDYVRGVE